MHAVSSAHRWGGEPELYLAVHEFIDSSKKVIGDVRHRAMYHHTMGVWLCQEVFGATISRPRYPADGKNGKAIRVPVRLIAEQHIIEDLGWLPSPADYLKQIPLEEGTWMGGRLRKTLPLSHILGTDTTEEQSDGSDQA